MTTHIFLDVDGVLNAVPTSPDRQASSGWGKWHTDWIMGYPITWSEDMVAALNELAARDDVVFHWLTTWEEHAVTDLIPVLGLKGEEWPVLYRSFGHIGGWWKTRALGLYLEDRDVERIVWVDDDHAVFSDHGDILRERGLDVLVVAPVTDTGLTREQYEQIVAFVDKGAEGVVS